MQVPTQSPTVSHDGKPAPLDCETLALLRSFLAPILETGRSWDDIADRLQEKGFGLAFRVGHLVLTNLESGETLCTARSLGVPLREISARIGRPQIRAHSGGVSGDLA
ncbi:hypothetical protein KUH32_07905 [Thalassococcus sp. CAU 1522]|uniref:DNA-binding protein n=1 Tax=Thalassococcus arenae TaxID=2851652 RepID=A0ABS6N7Y3_9RHOB|nr:hypothetical protein [Thalassococcus arenae]MBV2359694.1 hypothetical protein [Thalassococcus arenae]